MDLPVLAVAAHRPRANPHFERLGGAPVVERLVESFYRAMDRRRDADRIRRMHPSDLAEVRRVLAVFLTEWLGGPRLYSAERGAPRLGRVHQPFRIGPAERDAWMACMGQALSETCADPVLRAELHAAFWKVAQHLASHGDTSHHDTPTPTHRTEEPPAMSTLTTSALARLDAEGRLFNNVLKGPTRKPGRIGFRGDIALKFAAKMADEARPPEVSVDQVIATAPAGGSTIDFLTAFLLSFEYLKPLAEVLGEALSPTGTYILFCDNIDLSQKYTCEFGGATFVVLPIDEATVYNETLELLYLEKGDLKKLDTAAKVDAIADKAVGFKPGYPKISFEEGLAAMGPVRNLYADRPV